jgi:hypothetical protein
MMCKSTRNYLLDSAMGILGILLTISLSLLWVVFPRGYHATRALWVDIHKWGGLALSVLAVAHLALHWKWLVRMTRWQLERIRGR